MGKSPVKVGFFLLLGATALGMASAAAGGCTVLSNDGLPDDAGVFEGGEAGDAGACTSCVESQCLSTWSVCLLDPACRAIHACGGTSQCVCAPSASDASVAPENAYRSFAACNAARTCGTTCQSSCTSRCGGDGGPSAAPSCSDAGATGADAGDAGADAEAGAPVATGVDACSQCAASTCGDASRACDASSECAKYLACVFDCAGEACANACETKHATGKAAATELATCTTTGCASACGF